MKKIYLVFTRDNNQWVNEMVDFVFVNKLPHIFGAGLTTQITYFTGRTFEWYRFVEEMNKLKAVVISKKLSDSLFKKKNQVKFLKEVAELRQLISINPKKVKNDLDLLQEIKSRFLEVYPLYVLAVFLPGPWRDDFIKVHGSDSNKILNLLFKSREGSEGLLKEITNFMRFWLGPQLQKVGQPSDYLKLLSILEVEEFVKQKKLPTRKELDKRLEGFVHMYSSIFKIKDLGIFLKDKNISVETEKTTLSKDSFSGSVAYAGKIVHGKVKIILNSMEMAGFKEGMILVTPMTAPEYLAIMKKATAIITNEGGITCHAAIVARELKKPCIIGTKIATQVLKDGDMVEVDTSQGIIRKINI